MHDPILTYIYMNKDSLLQCMHEAAAKQLQPSMGHHRFPPFHCYAKQTWFQFRWTAVVMESPFLNFRRLLLRDSPSSQPTRLPKFNFGTASPTRCTTTTVYLPESRFCHTLCTLGFKRIFNLVDILSSRGPATRWRKQVAPRFKNGPLPKRQIFKIQARLIECQI
jgi:hypothetical protein